MANSKFSCCYAWNPILPGVDIGDGTVVEAGSVVMKSLSPGCKVSAPSGEGTTAASEP